MTELEDVFQRVTGGFYRHRDIAMAERALGLWFRMLAGSTAEDADRMMNLMYLFGRIGDVSPEARAAFTPMVAAYAGPHAELAKRMLAGGFPDVLKLAIEGPPTLDLLWAEFFVTGSADPLRRIASTLDWEDLTRAHLETWVRARSWFGGGKRRATADALAAIGLHVDLDQQRVVTEGDLDCAVFAIAERKVRIFPMLPFALSQAELARFATKAAAVWSLRLNAASHEVVADLCRVEAKRAGGAARRLLADPTTSVKPFAL